MDNQEILADQDKKQVRRLIRKISNTSSLPVFVYFVLYFAMLNFVLPQVFKIVRRNGIIMADNTKQFIQYLVIYLLIMPVSIFIFQKIRGSKVRLRIRECYKKPEKSAGWMFKWVLIGWSVTVIAGVISDIFLQIIQIATGAITVNSLLNYNLFLSGFPVKSFVFSLLPLSIFAPFFEELLFRGLIFRNNEQLGQWFAVIVSGLIFGFWHMDFQHSIYASVLGMVACYMYLKSKSLIPSMILHFLINSFYLARSFVLSSINMYELKTGNIEGLLHNSVPLLVALLLGLIVMAVVVTGIVLLIIEIIQHKESFKLAKCELSISRLKKILIYFTSPLTIALYVLMIFIIVKNVLAL